LIVTCEECSTSFQLDEARIPESGAQVRCSRCKHAFFLPSPSASQSQATHSIAEEAAHDPMSNVPPVASDASDLASTVGAVAPDLDPEEEDWQFSEEIRSEGDEDLEPESDFGVSQDFGSGLDADELLGEGGDGTEGALDPVAPTDSGAEIDSVDLDSSSGSGLELESSSGPEEPVRDESDFGSVDDFSSLMEDDDVAPVDLAAEIESELETAESASPTVLGDVESAKTDDLGDPESWDLVGNHDFTASKSSAGPLGNPFQDDAFGSGFSFEDDTGESPYEEESGSESPLWQGLVQVGNGIGWVITIASVVVVLGLGLRTEWTRLSQSPQTVSVGAMTADTTQASWVETSRSGSILIVAGELRNTGNVPLWPGTVQLALLDADGGRLTSPPMQAGERLAESILREASPDELIASASAAALSLRDRPLAPGETRAFEAIALGDLLPERARRVLLEIGEPGIVVEPAWPAAQVEEESDLSP
jgi:predicted Zn finger-like uncharacterized protein